MKKTVFSFACPCCGKSVEVDTRTGKARATKPEEKKGGGDLDALLDAQKRESDRLGDLFDAAQNSQASDLDRLEQQLKRAKKDAKNDKDERPPNIFDLD